MRNVLLIAGLEERYYYEPFIKACHNLDISIHICDPSRYPVEMLLSIEQAGQKLAGYIDTYQLLGDEFVKSGVKLNEIAIAWYVRENYRPSSDGESDSLDSRFRRNETAHALEAILSTLDCVWINSHGAMDRVSSNKLYQQVVAASSGLLTPDTIVSNDPDRVTVFARRHRGALVKTIGYIRLDDDDSLAIYSERFSADEIRASTEAIRLCPVFAQTYIEKKYEHRVMVIGDEVLACRIDSQSSEKTKTDWRHYDFDNVEHVQVDLPDQVKDSLRKFMKKIDLRFGAIDLIETPSGEFVFLEVNPSGQWGWIHDLAGLPIPESVARMLSSY
ncbi:MAG: hypothetical protein KBC16_01920 [Candidatus Pacebacteria bacterium]|nr:hypothetical protein [Candidatus Paceibacterota bacterium]